MISSLKKKNFNFITGNIKYKINVTVVTESEKLLSLMLIAPKSCINSWALKIRHLIVLKFLLLSRTLKYLGLSFWA